METDNSGHHFLEAVEVDYTQVGATRIWFPQKCVYESLVDRKSQEKEDVKIEVLSLNEPLSPTAFKLAGMDIPLNYPSSGYKSGGFSTWDGQQIIPEEPPPEPIPEKSFNVPYVAAASVLALFAAVALFFFFARKKSMPKT